MKRLVHVLFPVVAFLSATMAMSQHRLQYNFTVGDQFKIEQRAEQRIVMELDGAPMITDNLIVGILDFEVTNVNETGYIINTAFLSLVFKSESDTLGPLMDVDTERDADKDDLQTKIFSGMLGVPFEIHMLRTGEITALKNSEKMVDQMIASSGVEDETTKQLMRQGVEKEFGAKKLAQSMEQLLFLYAQNPVAVGGSWENQYSGNLQVKNTWTLNNYGTNDFAISANADVVFNTDISDDVVMEVQGQQETTALLETKTGFPKEISVVQAVEGMSQVMEMEVPTKLTSTITYKRL